MQEKTKEQLIQLAGLVKAGGWKAIPMWKVPKHLRNAMEVGLNNGLFTKESRKAGMSYGVQQHQDWLVIPSKEVSPTPQQQAHAAGQARREMDYRMDRAEFIRIARTLPGATTIMQRIEALADNDIKALDALKAKVYEYYNIDPVAYWKEVQQGKEALPQVAQSREMTSTVRMGKAAGVNTFPLERGEFRQLIKQLQTQGTITPVVATQLLDKVNQVRVGDTATLVDMKQKLMTHYGLEPTA